jgi:arginine:pyruvate transaminase
MADEAEARGRRYCAERQRRFLMGIEAIPRLRALIPEAGMFMLLDVSATGLSGGEFMRSLYAQQRVSLMDGAAFGEAAAHCVRVCFAVDDATLDDACARLRAFCQQDLPALRAGRPSR